ncbi:MAG: ATP-dependent zinc protease [Chromatiales bacterium]|nr:ATP-dependent zinc protease [Chromatiales bacterium]
MLLRILTLLCLAQPGLALAKAPPPESGEHRQLLGWLEWVQLERTDGGQILELRAKLDTGATTSSINAQNQRRFTRNGERWVAFDVADPHEPGSYIRFERPVVRNVRIRRAGGSVDQRPVVELGMCLGDAYRKRQFTLADRSAMDYQVLVGRNFMERHIIVDPTETWTRPPQCEERIELTGGWPEPLSDTEEDAE